MSWLNGELILNGMSKKDLAYAHDYIRSTVRNNGDTEEFPNLGENLLPIVQRKIICKSYEDAKELADSLNWEREYNLLIPFKDVDNIKETKKMKNLHERIKKEETKLNEYVKKTDCKNYKSKYIGCPQCGSKINKEYIYNYLEKKLIKDENSECAVYVKDAIVDSYKRLIGPSVEREIRSELTEKSEEGAIEVFAKNLENYLLTPPMKDKMILGLDPAYRTGCKLAVIDYTGQMLDIKVIYPHEPKNDFEGSKKIVLDLIDKYNIDIIAIGNGTASRESETFIANVIKDAKRSVSYIIVNEAGASVYSASKLAIEEFPNLHVEERSAISIARRLQDPLSELVKIDSKSIGVGQYQHDVKEKNLNEALDFVVSKSVNNVGVNINTASASILKYISGLTKKSIEKIIDFRNKHGRFNSRNELIDNKILSAKAYEQSIGFMRVLDGSNPLDKTSIHPESYNKTTKLLESIGMNYDSLGTEELISKLDNINIDDYSKKLDIDIYTLEDIINSLKKPNRDPRDDFDKPILKSDVLHIEDLKKGMELEGTVRNVVDFGAFIDIGIKNDGLVHISKITDRYIKHPSEVLSVGDIVTCYVDEVFLDKGKVALSLIKNDEK